jgi:hypothetical protein
MTLVLTELSAFSPLSADGPSNLLWRIVNHLEKGLATVRGRSRKVRLEVRWRSF